MSRSTKVLVWTSVLTVVLLTWETFFNRYNVVEIPSSIEVFTKVDSNSIDIEALKNVNR